MEKPLALPVIFTNIPYDLKKIPRWVMWRFMEVGTADNKRWSKIPFQPNNQQAKANDPFTWTDFLSVQEAYNSGRFDGIGFVFTDDDNLAGVDLDDCFDYQTERFTNAALQQIAENVKGYMEISPSGTGVKIFTRANLSSAHVDHTLGLEVYNRGRYFTVTGHHVSGEIPADEQDITAFVPERTIHRTGDAFADYVPPLEGYDLHKVETEVLSKLSPECGYTDWLQVGFALHHQFSGDVEALQLWEDWSFGNGDVPSYTATGPMSCEGKWSTFRGQGATLRSLLFKINQEARTQAMARGEVILDNASPLNHAKNFLDNMFSCEEGYRLVHYADEFFAHTGTHYEPIEESTVRSKLYAFLDKCKKSGKKGEIVPFNPTPASVSAAMDAVKAVTHLANHPNTKPPIWLCGYEVNKPDASQLISLKNGLFHLQNSALLPHSLGFFTQNSLPFDYNPQAQCPQWLKFLDDLWGEDQESIDCLQEMFGYIISGDTRQQKFFNLIGPRRSGKGTINKVLVSLLGQHNTVAPQLEELCDTFGLQPWLGKLLASFTDARAPERNRSAVVSQLLRIVGGDTITVNRKNKEAWNGYLPTRIVIYSNEALQLTENSNALTGRMVVLKMTNTFYGKEDADLANKLEVELNGIFNWAVDGMARRIARGGYFLQPKSGQEYLDLMQEIGNPMGTFAEDALEFDPLAFTPKDDVFNCYKHWALKKSIPVGTELAFKRRFLASTQEHRVSADLIRDGGDRQHIYRGVRLNNKAQKYVESISTFESEIF
jgi:P4 family phage/plasmid primase-like protien